jgi:hypothetical protein
MGVWGQFAPIITTNDFSRKGYEDQPENAIRKRAPTTMRK